MNNCPKPARRTTCLLPRLPAQLQRLRRLARRLRDWVERLRGLVERLRRLWRRRLLVLAGRRSDLVRLLT